MRIFTRAKSGFHIGYKTFHIGIIRDVGGFAIRFRHRRKLFARLLDGPLFAPQIAIFAPSLASRSAIAKPIPRVPPVIIATLPLRGRSTVFSDMINRTLDTC